MNRREALRLLSSASAAALLAAGQIGFATTETFAVTNDDSAPPLAPGLPRSPERIALIDVFRKQSAGLDKKFEARTFKSDWLMPYRLFRPVNPGKLPLVIYLHGSGGLGDDNEKQLGLGNIFGTRVWLLPENQRRFPCYVVAPQTNRGWIRYDLSQQPAKELAGLGDGARIALELVDSFCREFSHGSSYRSSIDEQRIYVTGQSMGGAGVWNMLANRPKFFAGAAICCGSISLDDGTGGINTPLWNFHGDSDRTVPVSSSRDRIAARRKAGGHPLYTEYAGVDHNSWEWAYTEPELLKWMFSQVRT